MGGIGSGGPYHPCFSKLGETVYLFKKKPASFPHLHHYHCLWILLSHRLSSSFCLVFYFCMWLSWHDFETYLGSGERGWNELDWRNWGPGRVEGNEEENGEAFLGRKKSWRKQSGWSVFVVLSFHCCFWNYTVQAVVLVFSSSSSENISKLSIVLWDF